MAAVDADTNASSSMSPATILDAIPGIGLLVPSDGEIRQWNPRAAAVWDGDVSLRGVGVTAAVVPDARERLAEAFDTGNGSSRHPSRRRRASGSITSGR